jgi:hypothetical protein
VPLFVFSPPYPPAKTRRSAAAMCRATTCACGKASWAGCGQHNPMETVLGGVKDEDRCPAVRSGQPPLAPGQHRSPCPDTPAGRAAATAAAAAAAAAATSGGGGCSVA